MTFRIVVVTLALAMSACGSGVASTAPGPLASTDPSPSQASPPWVVPAPASGAALVPVCANREPPPGIANAQHAKDGVADPAGRIIFGRLTRVDSNLGQLVSLNAIDPDGSDLAQILDCETERPRFSRDGSRLAFSIAMSDGTYQVATSVPDGSDLRVIPSNSMGLADTVDWSADGTSFVYSFGDGVCVANITPCQLTPDWSEHLWQMRADGSDQRPIGNPDTLDWEPRVSPDGTEVVFSRWADNTGDELTIWVRNLATGDERQVVDGENRPEHPDWSPDGRWIVYNTAASGGLLERIERVPSKGPMAKPTIVYGDAFHHGIKPAYSPDGKRIVFGGGYQGDSQDGFCRGLCVMDSDGSDVRVLYEEPDVEINHFAWGVVPEP